MASSNLWKSRLKTDITNQDAGYKNVLFYAPVDTFASIKVPTASPTALGDTKKITQTHTFNTDEGFIQLLCKTHGVTTKATSTGDDGAQSLEHTFEGIILGDDASTLEQLEAQLNDYSIWLVKDQDCINTTEFVQFGDECLQPTIKLEFDGKTTKEGLKEYKIMGTVKKKKFFYSGTVTEKP